MHRRCQSKFPPSVNPHSLQAISLSLPPSPTLSSSLSLSLTLVVRIRQALSLFTLRFDYWQLSIKRFAPYSATGYRESCDVWHSKFDQIDNKYCTFDHLSCYLFIYYGLKVYHCLIYSNLVSNCMYTLSDLLLAAKRSTAKHGRWS